MIHENSSETEARYFFTAWKNGDSIDKLRAEIRPGKQSDAQTRELRMRVLYKFNAMVEAAGRRAGVA